MRTTVIQSERGPLARSVWAGGPRSRSAFTLVELLVAIGIMLVLVGLALVVANSGVIGNHRLKGGSDRVSGWLMQARARAQREGAPRGVRFIPDANGFIREAQLIEVPDSITPAAGSQMLVGQWVNGAVTEHHVYVYNPNVAALNALLNNVSAGDTLSVPSLGTIHRITGLALTVVSFGGANVNVLEVTVADPAKVPDLGAGAGTLTAPPSPTYATTTFGFHRQPRPVFGEPGLLVPEGITIEVANSVVPLSTDTSLTAYDIIFAPNGEVTNATGLGRVMLWVRNPEAFSGNPRTANGGGDRPSYEQAGEMSLITVYTKTGAVAVHPVTLPAGPGPNPGHDPYQYTKDGIASGL